MPATDFVFRILTAILCGLFIGIERQLTGHMAGIRINVLVSFGTCLFVLFSVIMDAPDTTRIAAQIVSGVGFLCSGIIFKDGVNVRGLNTAATIWCTAAIGVLCSSGNFKFAALATLMLLLSNLIFKPVASIITPLSWFDDKDQYYKVSVVCSEDSELKVRSLIMHHIQGTKLTLVNLESGDIIGNQVEIEATLAFGGKRKDEMAESLIAKASLEKGVTAVGWELV